MLSDPLMFFIFGIAYLIISLIVFLVLRQFTLWYFRLNEIADSIIYIADYFRRQERTRGENTLSYPASRPDISTPSVKPLTPTQDTKLRRGWE